ncbi:MAG TPA: hypothetical protein VEO74_06465 [Thermoanaerobaculia bacterium]|nr:hypothetical protein [Thermoanaerobaculia bacterium]
MRCCLAIAALLVSLSAFADDCDIVLQPAATLLLPYFEVDFKAQQQAATQTLFTIQNTSHLPQIAHVTVWTDWGFPALNSPVFLTGYDVQGINLYDVFARATIAGQFGTSSNTAVPTNPTPGSQPAGNDANPQLMNASAACTILPGRFSSFLLTYLQQLFTTGVTDAGNCSITARLGGVHKNAIGYVTVDVFRGVRDRGGNLGRLLEVPSLRQRPHR